MKPLTIEQLKALPVGDWVWVVFPTVPDLMESTYIRKSPSSDDSRLYDALDVDDEGKETFMCYSSYGKTWLAYKNKEAAEAKGEIVELPCIAMIEQGLVDGKMKQTQEAQGFNGRYAVVYIDKMKCKIPLIDICWSREGKCRYIEAERRLAELKGEKV